MTAPATCAPRPPLQTLAADGYTLSPELIVADLDRGELRPLTAPTTRFPTSVERLVAAAPPAAALIKRLTPLASPERFDESAVQVRTLAAS